MNRYYKSALLVIFSSILCVCQSISTESVPVVFWNYESNKPVPALQHVGKKSFKEIVTTVMKEQPFLIVFQDENLSPEDFTSKDTSGTHVFESLHSMIKEDAKGKMFYISSVQTPKTVFLNMAKQKEPIAATAIRSGEVSLPKPTPGGIVVIHLDEAHDDDDRPHLLKRHAQFMIDIFTEVHNAYPNTIAAYTAERPSWYVSTMGLSRKSRQLLETEVGKVKEGAVPYADENIRLYLAATPYYVKDQKKSLLENLTWTTAKNDSTIEVTGTSENGTFVMKYTTKKGYWKLSSVTIEKEELRFDDISAPFGFSYHCSDLKFGNNNMTSLHLPKAQIEPQFQVLNKNKFGDAYDCVGFTSIPIWSGLFVTLILAAIMTLGLTMIMDIKTMDRFDDPKGKGITINVVE